MSMTTPRVTVPPQALEAIAFNLCSLHDFDVAFVRENERFATAVITEYARALSAAPAPEGGAVSYAAWDVVRRVANLTVAGGDPLQDPAVAKYPAIADLVSKAQSALATRELLSDPQQLEAPAEAAPCPFCGCRMRVSYDSEREMYGPDGDHLPGCIIGNWDLHEYAFRPDALAAWNSRSVRAQPPAREVPAVNIKCETDVGTAVGSTRLNVIRVEREDDGSFTAVTDHWLPAREDAQPVADAVEPIERAVAALKGHIEAIQVAKADGGSSSVITDCVNGLPEIVRWIESGVFNVEAAFEQHEDTHPAPDALRVAVEALEVIRDSRTKVVKVADARAIAAEALAALQAEQKGGV